MCHMLTEIDKRAVNVSRTSFHIVPMPTLYVTLTLIPYHSTITRTLGALTMERRLCRYSREVCAMERIFK